MVQVLPAYQRQPKERKPTFSETFGLNQLMANIGKGAGEKFQELEQESVQKATREKENEFAKQMFGEDISGLSNPKAREQYFAEKFKGQRQASKFDLLKNSPLGNYLGAGKGNEPSSDLQGNLKGSDIPNEKGEIDVGNVKVPSIIPDEAIYTAEALGEHGLAQQFREHNKQIFEQDKLQQKKFIAERDYHTKFSSKAEEEAESMRKNLTKKEMSLSHARDAIESNELGYFSKDKLADSTGIDLFRTAKGAQLITAAKENLLSNMGRVSGRAQNMWFEQRLNSMFPKIGQSREANLTVQEMLEGELALDQAYLNEFDKLAQRDMKEYGYVKKDISKRAHENTKPKEKEILQRTTYRMREIEEQEKGLSSLKKQVGKNVSKGTPLTLGMMKLYTEKFGDNAIKVAEKNGYYIPTLEEFKRFRTTNQEMLEGL